MHSLPSREDHPSSESSTTCVGLSTARMPHNVRPSTTRTYIAACRIRRASGVGRTVRCVHATPACQACAPQPPTPTPHWSLAPAPSCVQNRPPPISRFIRTNEGVAWGRTEALSPRSIHVRICPLRVLLKRPADGYRGGSDALSAQRVWRHGCTRARWGRSGRCAHAQHQSCDPENLSRRHASTPTAAVLRPVAW